MSETLYKWKLKKSKRGMVFCSTICSSSRIGSTIYIKCSMCKKDLELRKWDYDRRIRNSERNMIFCSPTCSLTGRNPSKETKQKISSSQKGISVMRRGRIGHDVTEKTKEKIRSTKLGVSSIKDNDIILRDLKKRDYDKMIDIIKVIPDAIMIKDGKLIALEVEKKRWENDVRKKMKNYIKDQFDIVIISWYLPNGEWVRDFIRENDIWS